ncbi:CocE/NonD family hydrolase [Martelella alba]|uniref:CocE/NonD family hydrolase n=1 Tax=Martelella alba TaxID=2590451 RepID=A0ABY2SGX4_9HYPH|nr:CocE/NonD family hydrolase [Martelella alba]TKI04232.1 CocE/NonD family hydrolase [Martelella alba]
MKVIETAWIPLQDGNRLAARIWLPEGDRPSPAVLEYLPYRRRDRHRGDDALLHPGLAEYGYVAIRVDMRGSGDSDGLMNDEYTPREWNDACEVIAWIAAQPWCSGAVGMIGISWSGFNSLQIAALRPPALKAIVTACSTDDRYADDMHYMGGVLLNDNLQYGATLLTWTPTPPDPAVVGDRWKTMWLERLHGMEIPPAGRWMSHPTRDAYWRSGSVCEDYALIEAPVLAVGGWADGYTNTVLRLLENLPGPRKGLIGPWGHAFPHVASPGPRIDFIRYVARWFDHWLKHEPTGIMDEPMLTYWLQEAEPPRARYTERRGRWAAERYWPSPAIGPRLFALASGGRLREDEAAPGDILQQKICSPAVTGLASGEWCPYGWGPDMPGDQREDDAGSACFDGPPLSAPLYIAGRPTVRLRLSADQVVAMAAVRLNAVAPDGVSLRISYGLLNLTQRNGHDRREPLIAGKAYDVVVPLNAVAFALPAGYRLRVAISSAYWPLAAPLPVRTVLTLYNGSLALPVRDSLVDACPPPDLGASQVPPAEPARVITPPARGRLRLSRDMNDGDTTLEVVRNLGALFLKETGLRLDALGHEIYTINALDPRRADSLAVRSAGFQRGDWCARLETRSRLSADNGGWRLDSSLEAFDGDDAFFHRQWSDYYPFFDDALPEKRQ